LKNKIRQAIIYKNDTFSEKWRKVSFFGDEKSAQNRENMV